MDVKNLCPHTLRHVAGMLRERSELKSLNMGRRLAMADMAIVIDGMASAIDLRDVGIERP